MGCNVLCALVRGPHKRWWQTLKDKPTYYLAIADERSRPLAIKHRYLNSNTKKNPALFPYKMTLLVKEQNKKEWRCPGWPCTWRNKMVHVVLFVNNYAWYFQPGTSTSAGNFQICVSLRVQGNNNCTFSVVSFWTNIGNYVLRQMSYLRYIILCL